MSAQHPESTDPIPVAIRELLAVFRERLGEVTFPDASAETLASKIDAVREQAHEVTRIRALLDAAREVLEDEQRDLRSHADKALAYARVYAGSDPALGEALASLSLSPPSPGKQPKKRGRKKAQPKSQLPLDATADAVTDATADATPGATVDATPRATIDAEVSGAKPGRRDRDAA